MKDNNLLLIIFLILMMPLTANATQMNSSNYAIDSYVVSDGGTNMTSANYNTDVVIGTIAGNMVSSLYKQFIGFWHTLLDSIPPYVQIVLPQNETYDYDLNLPLNYTATDPNLDTVWYCIDGVSNITITGNTTFNITGNGQHYIDLWANDTAGNINTIRRYFNIHTKWYANFELNNTLSMRGKSIYAKGTIVDIYGNNLTCQNCLNISWGDTIHQNRNVTNGSYNDTYTIGNSDNNMTVILNVSYSDKDGSNSTNLIVRPIYNTNINCSNYVLNKNQSLNCSAQIHDIDFNLISSDITADFRLYENLGFNFTDTEHIYLWAFETPGNVGTYTINSSVLDSFNNTGQNNSVTFTVRELNINLTKEIKVLNNKGMYESSDIVFARYDTGEFKGNVNISINITDKEQETQNEANITMTLVAPNKSVVWIIEKQTNGGLSSHNFALIGLTPKESGEYILRVNATDNQSIIGIKNISINVSFWKVKMSYNTTLSPFMKGEKIWFNITTLHNNTLTNTSKIEIQLRDDNSNPVKYCYWPSNITNYETGKYSGNFSTGDLNMGDYFFYAKISEISQPFAEDKHADITIGEDPEAPQFWANKTHPNSSNVHTGTNQFNITVSDNTGTINTVLLEINNTNYTVFANRQINSTHYEYHTTLSLVPDIYTYRWYANDSSGNTSTTTQWNYVVEKANIGIDLYFNGAEGNRTYEKEDIINITAIINISGKPIELWTDFSGAVENVQNSTTILINITDSSNLNLGVYNITALFVEDQNYTSSFKTYFITIQDSVGPTISNINNIDPLEYNTLQNISATIVDINNISTALLERDNSNYTMNPGYWYAWTPNQIPGDIVGFTIFSNDTLNNWNSFSSSFSIVDTTKPIIHGIDILPSVSQVNDIVQIKASVIDNYLVDLVWAEITKPSLSTTNIVLNTTYEPDEDGNHSIIVFANDTSGNTANSSHYFIVLNPENITLTPSAYITVISIGSSNITTLTINNTGDITTVVNIYDSSQSWVIYSNTTFDVENKSAVNITINITVPQDTIPGDYVYLVTANTSIAQDTANLYITVPDEQPPIIHNIIYNNITFGNNQTIIVNATDNKQIDVCSIDYNGTNITMDNCSYTYMPEEVGLINFAVYVNDTSGNINASQEQYIVTDINEPNIISYSILPKAVIIDKNISIDINATDDYMINYTWANITKPDSNFTMLYLPANYTATQVGRYNITFFVNDTSDNTANATDYFISQNEMIFNGSISDGNYSPISTNTTFYFSQTENIISNINTTGNFSVSLPEYLYDIKISLENQTILTLNQVNLSLNNEKEILIEMPANSLDLRTCAINTTYIYGTATLVLSYNNTAYSNENYISAYKCNEWNFVGQECLSGWERYANATQNKDCKLFTIYTNSFSAFSLKQDSYCGNGICNSDESCSSCSDDCGSCSSSSSSKEMNVNITGNCLNTLIDLECHPNSKINVHRANRIIGSFIFSVYADDKGYAFLILNETGSYLIEIIAEGYVKTTRTINIIDCSKREIQSQDNNDFIENKTPSLNKSNESVDVVCECGFLEDDICAEYECCDNADCAHNYECINHNCSVMIEQQYIEEKNHTSVAIEEQDDKKQYHYFKILLVLLVISVLIVIYFKKPKRNKKLTVMKKIQAQLREVH